MASAASLRLASLRSGWLLETIRAAQCANCRSPSSSHSPRDRRAAITRPWSQPAWQRTSTLPSSASRIDRLGSRSSCAGHLAIQPPPAFRPPRALAMVSVFMAHLAVVRRGGVIGGGEGFHPRPLGENAEEAGDIVRDLLGVLVGEVATVARLPDLPGPVEMIFGRCVLWFHRRPAGPLFASPLLVASGLGLPPMTLG